MNSSSSHTYKSQVRALNIKYQPRSTKQLLIPKKIRAAQNTNIVWKIKNFDYKYLRKNFLESGLVFTVYFDKDSPFDWDRKDKVIYGDPIHSKEPNTIIIAEGIAENKGTFKYGIKITDINNEPIYDDDPLIIVF